jgi:hypothetical protein
MALSCGIERQWQILNLPLVDDRADVGGFGLEGGGIGEDGERLVD